MKEQSVAAVVKEGKENIINNSSLDDLLAWDGTINITSYVDLPALAGGRPSLHVNIKSLSSQEMDNYRNIATMEGKNRNTGATIKELDDDFYNRLIIFHSIVEPDLSAKDMQQRFNPAVPGKSRSPSNIVDKIFLPGEKIELTRRIYELSGFSMEEELEHKVDDSDLS